MSEVLARCPIIYNFSTNTLDVKKKILQHKNVQESTFYRLRLILYPDDLDLDPGQNGSDPQH